jgi:Icc-related predicted phosphoesterase
MSFPIMKILVIGDLHGRKPIIKNGDFDCMVCVGDICSDKKIAPLYKKWFTHIKENSDNYLDSDDFFESIGYNEKKMKRLEAESFRVGKEILKYLDGFDKPIFLVPGNWDQSWGESMIKNMNKSDYNYIKTWLDRLNGDGVNPKLLKGLKNVCDCQFKVREFLEINFIGYGLSNNLENPLRHKKRSFSKVELVKLKFAYKKLIDRLISSYGDKKNRLPCIFISHNTPYKTKLDVIKDKNSYAYKKHLGSSVARLFCLRKKPVLCLCGHIHEGRGKCKLGKTLVVNPGYGEKAQVLIDFDEIRGKVRKVEFMKK